MFERVPYKFGLSAYYNVSVSKASISGFKLFTALEIGENTIISMDVLEKPSRKRKRPGSQKLTDSASLIVSEKISLIDVQNFQAMAVCFPSLLVLQTQKICQIDVSSCSISTTYVFEDHREAVDMCCHKDMETEDSCDIMVAILFSDHLTMTLYKISASSRCLFQIRHIRLGLQGLCKIDCYQSCYFVSGNIVIEKYFPN